MACCEYIYILLLHSYVGSCPLVLLAEAVCEAVIRQIKSVLNPGRGQCIMQVLVLQNWKRGPFLCRQNKEAGIDMIQARHKTSVIHNARTENYDTIQCNNNHSLITRFPQFLMFRPDQNNGGTSVHHEGQKGNLWTLFEKKFVTLMKAIYIFRVNLELQTQGEITRWSLGIYMRRTLIQDAQIDQGPRAQKH